MPETIDAGALPWVTPDRLERLRVDWNMTARVLDTGVVYVSFGGLWCSVRAGDFHAGVEHAIDKILELRHRMGAPSPGA